MHIIYVKIKGRNNKNTFISMKTLKKIFAVLLLISMPLAALAAPVDGGMLEIDYMSSAPGSDFDIFTFVSSVIN
ncbi:MAG: hypothetical protein PHP14_01895 [Candidatus Pacebacteria bacterium]|nr:hypothetical protein [Candidatus Paceibacterota bacterium]